MVSGKARTLVGDYITDDAHTSIGKELGAMVVPVGRTLAELSFRVVLQAHHARAANVQ